MLKKFSVAIASLLLVICLFVANRVPVLEANEYEIYLKSYSTTSQIKTVKKDDYKFILGIKGESCTLKEENFCLDEFIKELDVDIVYEENLGEVVCYYGYSKKVKYLEMINGNLINVHIAIRKDSVKIGFPIIYGSF